MVNCFSANLASIVEKKVAMAHEATAISATSWLKTNSAGSGAYGLKSWKADNSIVLEANPHIWKAAPKLKRVITRHVKEPSSQRLLLEKGDIDMARDLTPDMIKVLGEDKNLKVSDYPKADEYYLGLNQNVEALAEAQGARGAALADRLPGHGRIRSSRASSRCSRRSGRRASRWR